MAKLKELALGLSSVLNSPAVPDPLPVELHGQSSEEAAVLLKLILDECADADISLTKVTVDPATFVAFQPNLAGDWVYRDTIIEADTLLFEQINIYRSASRP